MIDETKAAYCGACGACLSVEDMSEHFRQDHNTATLPSWSSRKPEPPRRRRRNLMYFR